MKAVRLMEEPERVDEAFAVLAKTEAIDASRDRIDSETFDANGARAITTVTETI